MDIRNIKKEMIKYRDFYGGDIGDTQAIKKAKTKEELAKIIEHHRNMMEDMLCDANSHLDQFKRKIGLDLL